MRLRREEWTDLDPDDVAWVTEWQLATTFPWIPIGEYSPVVAAPEADPGDRTWTVRIRAGQGIATAHLPVRDLAQVVAWCHDREEFRQLTYTPPRIRASLRAIRAALDRGLTHLDPLNLMGYAMTQVGESEDR